MEVCFEAEQESQMGKAQWAPLSVFPRPAPLVGMAFIAMSTSSNKVNTNCCKDL